MSLLIFMDLMALAYFALSAATVLVNKRWTVGAIYLLIGNVWVIGSLMLGALT